MRVSYSESTVNPDLPTDLGGYGERKSTKIHDDIKIQSLMIESSYLTVLHVIDVVLIEPQFAQLVKNKLHELFDIEQFQIIIQASHTHSGPQVSEHFLESKHVSVEYLSLLEETIVNNTKNCLTNLRSAKAEIGIGKTKNIYANRNNPDAYYNNQLYLLKFTSLDEEPIIDLLNISCHPTVWSPGFTEVSADYIGLLRKNYKTAFGKNIMVSNGEAGDVSTRHTRLTQDENELLRVSEGIIKSLKDINTFKSLDMNLLDIKEIPLNIEYNPSEEPFLKLSKEKLENIGRNTTESKFMLDAVNSKLAQHKIKVQSQAYLYEFKDIRFVVYPGELVSVLGQRLRSVDNKTTFIMAYANDFLGYSVDDEQYGKYFETYLSTLPEKAADVFIKNIMSQMEESV